jgi:hypothetical protein
MDFNPAKPQKNHPKVIFNHAQLLYPQFLPDIICGLCFAGKVMPFSLARLSISVCVVVMIA